MRYPWPENNTSFSGSFSDLITSLAEQRSAFQPITARLIDDEFQQVVECPSYQQLVIKPGSSSLNFEAMQNTVLDWYLASHDFCALHGITGGYAFSLILPYLEDPQAALNTFWLSLVLAYLCRPPVRKSAITADPGAITALKTKTIASMDAHTIKLTDVCLLQYERTGNIGYLQAAWSRLQ